VLPYLVRVSRKSKKPVLGIKFNLGFSNVWKFFKSPTILTANSLPVLS
jgi:hypothetical protein